MERNLVNILGYGVDTFSFDEAVDFIMNSHGQVVTINPEMIINANKNPEFASIINNAEMVVPDGVGIQLGLKLLGKNIKRIPGIDLGKALLQRAYYLKKTVAMIGATNSVIENAVVNIKSKWPDLNLVYYHDGYFEDNETVSEQLVISSPDLVLVALGSPKQEFFINSLKSKLPHSVFIGLGGSFDVWAGAVKRAPQIYQKLGIEWLYRLITEPKRFRRIFPTMPIFVFKVIKERLFNK